MAVNLRDDADTTRAVYGQLAGGFHGFEAIPKSWRSELAHGELILSLAGGLFCWVNNSGQINPPTNKGSSFKASNPFLIYPASFAGPIFFLHGSASDFPVWVLGEFTHKINGLRLFVA